MVIISSVDGANRLIFLANNISAGRMSFDAADLLSELIVWRNTGTTPNQNDRWTRPIRAVGGDSKGGVRRVGTSVFLMNNWLLVPATATFNVGLGLYVAATSHRLTITGDLQVDSATNTNGQLIFVNTSGVLIEYQSPNAIDLLTVSGSGGSGLTTQQALQLANLAAALESAGVFSAAALANAPSGGSGTADWTTIERNQIRKRLGIDGATATPSATPDFVLSSQLPTNFSNLAITPTTGLVSVGTNNDKSGYSLTQAFPANFSSLAITAGGAMTAGTVSDKTGYSLSGTQTFNLTGNITGNLSGSVGSVTSAVTLPTIPNNWITAAGIATDAITEIQSGLATSIAVSAIPTNPLLTTDPRLNNLDTPISTRSTYAGADTAGTTTLLSRLTSGRASNLDNLDALVSSRSTYAGADTAGTTTLLSRLTSTRAGYLDNLSGGAPLLASSYTAPNNSAIAAIQAKTDQLGFTSGNVNAIALAGSISVSAVANDAITAAALSADAIAEIQAGLATSLAIGNLPTLAQIEGSNVLAKQSAVLAIPTNPLLATSYIAPDNSSIGAIKAKTDLLTFNGSNLNSRVMVIDSGAASTISTAIDNSAKLSELYREQGGIPGVSVTVLDAEDGQEGYLRSSDNVSNKRLVKNLDGSVTIVKQ